MNSFLFNILKYSLYVWALFPLSVLYRLGDILYILVYKIVGYRKKVVRMNMRNAFPEYTDKELLQLEKKFYHHFCDYIMETIKLMHISDKEMMHRFRFTNPEEMTEILKDGKPVFMMLGHYGNWEWVPSISLWLPESLFLAQIYRPLKNKAADKFFLKLRSRFGSIGIAKNDTLREILRLRKEKEQIMVGFIADQTPSRNNLHYWTTFLNQESAVLTGTEKIGRKIGANIIYLDVRKVKRGFYEATFVPISLDSSNTPEFEITEKYIRAMEQTILRAPENWLWTHKRWKHKHL